MRPILAAACLAALAAPAAAERRQHGGAVYDLPPDWSQGRSEDGIQVLWFDGDEERCNSCFIHLGPEGPARGPLEGWLAAQSPRLVEPEDRDGIEVVQEAGLTDAATRPLAMMAFTAGGDIFVTFAVQAGDRYHLMGFEGWAYDGEEVERSLGFLTDEVTPFFDRIRYVAEGAVPLMPDPVPGGMSGLWWGWWLMPTIGLDGMMQTRMDYRTLAFWPDGRFYEGTPPGGLRPLDPAALAAAGDASWGVYREREGALALTYADGRTETLTAAEGGWSDGSRTLGRVEPLADGTALDGTVSSFSYTALGGGIEGGVTSSSSTTFFPDGRYQGESFGGAFGSFTDGAGGTTGGFATDGGTQASGGAYEVRDGLVVMRPADGSPPTAELAFRAEGDVVIGDQFLESE